MSTPAGWYPDPADSARTRWWDGAKWTEHTSPGAEAAQAAAAERPEVPRYGEYAPTTPAEPVAPGAQPVPPVISPTTPHTAPAYPSEQAYPSQQAYPAQQQAYPSGYPAAAPAVQAGPSAPGADTNTLWIYLSILASTLPILSLFLIDWNGYLDFFMQLDSSGTYESTAAANAMLQWTGSVLLISLLSYVFIALSIVFAWLDWRELKKRGVARPFHWGFAFFALVISIGVYIIGRTVVLKRETGSGMTALWVWIGSIVLSIVVSIAWFVWFWQQLLLAMPTYMLN